MTANAWNWILAIVGTIASIAGVVFSWMAWVQAAKAKDAAREATAAVRKRIISQEVLRLAGDAKEFLAAVQQNRTESAIASANNLVHALSVIRSRSLPRAPDADTLNACVNDILSVAIRLTVDGTPADAAKLEELVMLCHQIHRTVCDLAGRMERLSEGASQ